MREENSEEKLATKLAALLAEDAEDAYLELLRYICKPMRTRSWDEMQTFLPAKPWTYLPLDALSDAGFIEWGVSLRHPWVTDEGKAAVAFLEKHGTDAQQWPGEPGRES